MKLFHISQSTNRGYDTYSDAVVCADGAEEARQMHPMEKTRGNALDDYRLDVDDYPEGWDCSWTAPCNVSVRYIGEAHDSVPRGVVCASYHAG